MNVLFMAKETPSSIRSLKYLLSKRIDVTFAVLRPNDEQLQNICREAKIPVGSEEDFLLRAEQLPPIEYLLSFYWKLVKPSTLKIPSKGSINFHPGPLPEARGSGYHAAILNDWGYWGATAHYMDETFDTGNIICCERFPIPNDIVNRDLVRLAHLKTAELFEKIIDRISAGEILQATVQPKGTYYSLKELEQGKYIRADDSTETIKRKIRAYWNPPYSGAKIVLNGSEYTVIDDAILKYIAGPDRIRSDQIRSDQIRSDQIRSDQLHCNIFFNASPLLERGWAA